MSKPVVVIVEPYSSGNMYAPALRRAGFSTCGITLRSAAPLAASFRAADFDHHLEYGADDAAPITPQLLDPVLDRLRELAPVAVLPGEQHGVRLADRLAAELTPDRANLPELAAARWHKGRCTPPWPPPDCRSSRACAPAIRTRWPTGCAPAA